MGESNVAVKNDVLLVCPSTREVPSMLNVDIFRGGASMNGRLPILLIPLRVKSPTSTLTPSKEVSTVKELKVSSLKLPPTAASQDARSLKVVKLRALAGADILKTIASTLIPPPENSSKFKVS